jgi:hypothetical protein
VHGPGDPAFLLELTGFSHIDEDPPVTVDQAQRILNRAGLNLGIGIGEVVLESLGHCLIRDY